MAEGIAGFLANFTRYAREARTYVEGVRDDTAAYAEGVRAQSGEDGIGHIRKLDRVFDSAGKSLDKYYLPAGLMVVGGIMYAMGWNWKEFFRKSRQL